MRLVDKSDAMISFVECGSKNMKWYLFNLSTHNAHIMHREVTGIKETYEAFIIELIRDLLWEHAERKTPAHPSLNRGSNAENPLRLTQRHFLSTVPRKEGQRARPQRHCHVCSHTQLGPKNPKKLSRYECRHCDVGLCIEPCFEAYHTKKVF